MKEFKTDVVVIGAGLTGLTTAFYLIKLGYDVTLLDRRARVGGVIQTHQKGDYLFESGPNTAVVSNTELVELFDELQGICEKEEARSSAKRRLVYKKGAFHALPNSLLTAISTPLFTFSDKLRVLGEPFRKKGTVKNETVGQLAARRLGQSFVDYAVDPFISGIYAGNPYDLTTRFALPKLYHLEQEHGSFVLGAMRKGAQSKTELEKRVNKAVFSTKGGLEQLMKGIYAAMNSGKYEGELDTFLSISDTKCSMVSPNHWQTNFSFQGEDYLYSSQAVVTTCGSYDLPSILPEIGRDWMAMLTDLHYVDVVEISVGVATSDCSRFNAFGGLLPSKENRKLLGVLFPSACFEGRALHGHVLLSVFMGGVRIPDILQWSDDEIRAVVKEELVELLQIDVEKDIHLFEIFRQPKAIPQYREDSGDRFDCIDKLQYAFPGLVLAGNMKDGIGMPDRVKQGRRVAENIQQSGLKPNRNNK